MSSVDPQPGLIAEPVDLGPADPLRALTFLAQLRDRCGEGVGMTWRATVAPGFDTTLLHHLPPPEGGRDEDEEAVARWRDSHRSAQCYYRVGPGFIQVRDLREVGGGAMFLLDEPDLVSAFNRCLQVIRLVDLHPNERAAARELGAERLLLDLDGWAVTLPYRMRRWPVPSNRA